MFPSPMAKGTRFERLVIVRYVRSDSHSERFYEVKCDCGNSKIVRQANLWHGNTKSCGCLRHELFLKRNIGKTNVSYVHGFHKHPLYQVWQNFKQRCCNPKNPGYKHYGGRGIKVCASWMNDPEKFMKWGLANGWEKGLVIDRENNDGNYSPRNCRFVTWKVSSNNQRRRNG